METYAQALLYAIPLFIVLVLLEILYGYIVKKHTHKPLDTISSLSSGLTNIIKDSLPLVIIFVSYPTLLKSIALIHIEANWLTYVIGFITLDFAGYWNHRLSHKINFFWNQHVIHHSSEEFNLACALRQSISNILGYFPLLLIPAALLGVPAKVINILAPIHLFLQFWYHTRYIGKLGWLEYIIVTPSQHRVHHAINPEYIDKNLGQIFCVWDRMFGTFQEELQNTPPVYGVLKPASTWNPILINFQHLWRLMKDAWYTKNWKDKIRIWFMPTGWRPADMIDKHPYSIIENVYSFKKYQTYNDKYFTCYVAFQLICNTILMMFMFYNYSDMGLNGLFLCGLFVFTGIFGYTSLMDGSAYAIFIEALRSIAGILFIVISGDWFGLNHYLEIGSSLVLLYFIITLLGGWYFSSLQKKQPLNLKKTI